jgi:hypothetical protein
MRAFPRWALSTATLLIITAGSACAACLDIPTGPLEVETKTGEPMRVVLEANASRATVELRTCRKISSNKITSACQPQLLVDDAKGVSIKRLIESRVRQCERWANRYEPVLGPIGHNELAACGANNTPTCRRVYLTKISVH